MLKRILFGWTTAEWRAAHQYAKRNSQSLDEYLHRLVHKLERLALGIANA